MCLLFPGHFFEYYYGQNILLYAQQPAVFVLICVFLFLCSNWSSNSIFYALFLSSYCFLIKKYYSTYCVLVTLAIITLAVLEFFPETT